MHTENDVTRLVRDGRLKAALQLLQERRGKEGRPRREWIHELLDDLGELQRAGAPLTAIVGLFVKQIVAVAALIVALTAVFLAVSKVTLGPAVGWVLGLVVRLAFIPGVVPVLALVVLAGGFTLAHKFRSPGTFAAGMTGVALGLVCFWLFPLYIRLVQQHLPPELEVPLVIVGGVLSLFVFVGGIQLAAHANR